MPLHQLHLKSIQMKKVLAIIIACLFITTQAESQIAWEETSEIAPSSFGNHHPRVVTDANDNPLVIWGKSNNVMFTRWNGTNFTTPVRLNPDTISIAEASWMGPDIAAHGDTIFVVFKQTPENVSSSHIWCIRSDDGGISFSPPVQVDYINDSISRFPTVTTDLLGNPIVGFMKFNPSFGDARWVVTRSDDAGSSFSPDVLASGWSSSTSEVCDCCPGTITSTGNTVAMLYRDNNSNIRDAWAGVSTDQGNTFNGGMNIDQQNWMLAACPASGPDGVIIGDTLYSTYMNGASGSTKVYFNKSSLADMTGSAGNLLTENNPNVGLQNFPRIANSGDAVAIAWKQIVNGNMVSLPMLFTKNIHTGFPSTYDTITLGNVTNSDIALTPEKIYVFWQDDLAGTIKFKSGTYAKPSALQDHFIINDLTAYPNPSAEAWTVEGHSLYPKLNIELFNAQGALVYVDMIETNAGFFLHEIDNTNLIDGLYVLRFSHDHFQQIMKLVKH